MHLGRQWEAEPANSPDVILEYFKNSFKGWSPNMPEMLKKFTVLLGEENDGLNTAKEIREELYSHRNNIPEFANVEHLELHHLNDFLFSTNLNPPIVDQIHHDMNAPLSHYFIHTSLNSYLTGNFIGRFSDVPIIEALQRGVKVIELDIWPCGKEGICVTRKWTLETLELQKCLTSIKEHAFTDPKRIYPVIITFRDRLTPDLQSRATEMINQTFEDMVYNHDPDSSEVIPSPAELQKKIIITRRPPKEILEANLAEVKAEVKAAVLGLIDQDYERLVAFNAVEPTGMLLKALSTDNAKKIQRQGSYETDVIRLTQGKFLRTRLKSKALSKYKPQRGWMYGAQMIALSKQEYDRSLWLMQGMFRANGGCGYVKKPDFLLNANPTSEVFYPIDGPMVKKILKVKVYMGHGWSEDFKKRVPRLSAPHFYVNVGIAGVPHDEKILKTIAKKSDWNPIWGEDEFEFPLTYPELALLSIEVYDHNISSTDSFAGQTCLPVSELEDGTRAVPLYDEKGEKCNLTMLLIRFRLLSLHCGFQTL